VTIARAACSRRAERYRLPAICGSNALKLAGACSRSAGPAGGYAARMPEIAVTLNDAGEAYVALVRGRPPEVRHSVALDALEEADTIPALERLVLDFDHYGRVVGLRVTAAADSVLAPSLLEAAESGDPPSAEVS
jgi:hypothetical protein